MADTLTSLIAHLERQGRPPKVVVWEHNSHVGDARATEASRRRELNVGQLVRERYGDQAFIAGFTTYHGTVAAASRWDGPVERKRVRPGLPDSIEAMLHSCSSRDLLLPMAEPQVRELLAEPLLERAIGVIYRPETERESHYFEAHVPEQFDALLHYDRTVAVTPIDRVSGWEGAQRTPQTYPFGV
jgi:erythromycin esterase-like protein